jgi:hypothetical protein
MIIKHCITPLNTAYSLHWSVIFEHNSWALWCIWPILAWVQKFLCSGQWTYALATHKKQFPLPHSCGFCDLTSIAWMVQTIGWVMQKSPVKQPQQLFCWMCAIWGSIVVLKDHTSWQIMCLGCLRNTWGGYWFHNDKEVEVALTECMQMQEPNIFCSGCFKLVPGKEMCSCFIVLWG